LIGILYISCFGVNSDSRFFFIGAVLYGGLYGAGAIDTPPVIPDAPAPYEGLNVLGNLCVILKQKVKVRHDQVSVEL